MAKDLKAGSKDRLISVGENIFLKQVYYVHTQTNK